MHTFAATIHFSLPARVGCLLGLVIISTLCADAEQLPIRAYTSAQGLAQDRVKRIVLDSRGFLWFCTADGLSRFDGSSFTTYDVTRGLNYPSVNDLLETSDGRYWVATNGGGVFLFDPNAGKLDRSNNQSRAVQSHSVFIQYSVGNNARTNRVNRLFEDNKGRVWAGTDEGLFVLNQNQRSIEFQSVALNVPEFAGRIIQVWSFIQDSVQNLWVGTSSGLVRISPQQNMRRYALKTETHSDVLDMIFDREGRLWAAQEDGLMVVNLTTNPDDRSNQTVLWRQPERSESDRQNQRIQLPVAQGEAYLYREADGLPNNFVTSVLQAPDGRIWLTTHRGLTTFEGGRFRRYTAVTGLHEYTFTSLVADREGNIWFGTNATGALKLARNGLRSYREADGLSNLHIRKIFEDANGTICIINQTFIIECLTDNAFKTTAGDTEQDRVTDVLRDHLGDWWLATSNGVLRYNASSVTQLKRTSPRHYSVREGLPRASVRRLFEDSRGDVWIVTNGPEQLNRWERSTGKIRRNPVPDLPAEGTVASLAEDKAGGLWIGFRDHGLGRYAGGRFTLFTEEHGLPSRQVPTVYIDRAGRLWAGATARGLILIDEPAAELPKVTVYTTADGLSSNLISTITQDQIGRTYLGTTRTIDRFDPTTGRIRKYTVTDGLAGNESTSSYFDSRGRLWFGTTNGLSQLEPEVEERKSPPPILIGGLNIAGVLQPLSELGETEVSLPDLDYRQNQLRIDFFGLAFAAGDVLRYQFKLEGADLDWNAPAEQRSINYANLKPGAYRFLVRAVNADGLVSDRPASITFKILPVVWQRWWFIMISVFIVAGATHLIYRYHTRRLIELERIRTRIATDLHDDIGASLSKIAILTDVAEQELSQKESRVTQPLTQIADTSREMVDAMSDIVWAVNPQRDHLSDLTHRMRRFAEDMLDARDIEFTFRTPIEESNMRLGADLRREVYLIFKECINNLVKHSGCSRAELGFCISGNWLEISVRDNGCGFNAADLDQRSHGLGGHGLGSMLRRAQALGGKFIVDSEPGRGTLVTLKVPLRKNHGRSWLPWRYPNRR